MSKFEDKFGIKTDYFNHRINLFKEIEQWIEEEKQAYADEQNKELLEDVHEVFSQACWIEKEKKYDHCYISAYESMQKKLIKAGVIKQEDCYRP